MPPCGLVLASRRHQGEPWRGRQQVLLKRRNISTRLHRVTPQNAAIFSCWSPVFIFCFLRSFTCTLYSSCTPPSSVPPLPAIILSLLSPTSSLHLSDNLTYSPLLLSTPVLVFSTYQVTLFFSSSFFTHLSPHSLCHTSSSFLILC